MRPRPDQPAARHRQMLEQARDGVGVAVGPAADREDRALDRGVVLAHRAVPPIGVAPLVPQPQRRGRTAARRSRSSHSPRQRSPTRAGIGRPAPDRRSMMRAPPQIVVEQAAAHVVHVVGDSGRRSSTAVTIAFSAGGRQRRDLQRVEAAPRLADHADRARCTTAGPRARRSPRSASSSSCWQYSSASSPSDSPEPRMSTRIAA